MVWSYRLSVQTTGWPQFAMRLGVVSTQFGGRSGCRGLEMVPLSSPVVTSYRLHIVIVGLSHHFRNAPIGLSMVLRLRQHNMGYTADGFYRSDDPTNSVKALKEGG